MFDFVISLVVLAAIALFLGAIFLLRKGNTKQGVLMLVLSVVMAVNVAIWLVPTESGESLADVAAADGE